MLPRKYAAMKTRSITTTKPTRISTSRLTAITLLPLDENDARDHQHGSQQPERR